jgi:hypothetical protein
VKLQKYRIKSRYDNTRSNNIPLYAFMKDAGAIVEEDGGIYLLENLDYNDNETFNTRASINLS